VPAIHLLISALYMHVCVIMVALWNSAESRRPLYFCPVISIFLLFFFPRLISAVGDWMSTILPHMVWP